MFQPKILETKNTKILCEQKPINVDNFNEVEEKEVKERKRKQEETKMKEKDMWKRLRQLSDEFKEIKKSKKDAKKMSDTIIKH